MYRSYRTCCNCNQNTNNQNQIENTCNYVSNETYTDSCSCGFDEENGYFPSNPMYAQSYVPWQILNKTFTPEVGLKMGTIFPELVSPYMPGDSMAEIEYLKNSNIIGEGCNK